VSLARAETRRLFRRRLTLVMLAWVLLVLAAVAAGTFLSNQKGTAAQVTEAKAQAARQYQESLQYAEQDRQRCLAAQGTPEAANFPPGCTDLYTPQPEEFDYRWYMPQTFEFRDEFPDMITLFAVVLAAAAFLVGASFVGSEWHSGGMMNLLLWRPQRLRVLSAKLTVFLGWFTGLSLLLAAAWTGAFWLIAELRGSTDRMTSGVWQSLGLTGLRGLAVIVVAGVLGFALASLGRHTGMALGALIGLGAVQIGVYIVATLGGASFPDAFLAPMWAYAWMYKEMILEDPSSCDFSSTAGCEPETFTMTWQAAGSVTAVVVVVVVAAALWAMRRRDVS
jgi:ABC-2 type transport system permease protein